MGLCQLALSTRRNLALDTTPPPPAFLIEKQCVLLPTLHCSYTLPLPLSSLSSFSFPQPILIMLGQ